MKYHGFISPAPPKGASKELKQYMARTYAVLRKTKYPGENKENKMRAARITWYQTKRAFPDFFSHKKARTHTSPHYPALVRKEKKEHPWMSWKEAERVNIDHKIAEAKKSTSHSGSHRILSAARKKQGREIKSDNMNLQEARTAMIER